MGVKEMTRFKADCRFHIKELLSVAGWMYAIEITMIIIGVLVTVFAPDAAINTENDVPTVGMSVQAQADMEEYSFVVTDEASDTHIVVDNGDTGLSAITMNFSGMEATSWITFFITGIICFSLWLKNSMANCIPRKKEFLSAIASVAIFAVFLVAGNYIINFICELISDKAYYGAWDLQFGMKNDRGRLLAGGEKFLYHFAGVIFNYVSIVSCFFGGYFIGALYYRMNTALKIAVSVGVPALLFVGFPLVTYIMMNTGVWDDSFFYNIGYKLGEFSSMINNSMGLTILECLGEAVIYGGLSFLLIRKAPVK